MFSVSGPIASWQRSRLQDTTIRNLMTYKATMKLREAVAVESKEADDLVVSESLGKIPKEWEDD